MIKEKKRTTLALPLIQHQLLIDMSLKTELEMSKMMQWGLATLMNLASVRAEMKLNDPKLHDKLDSGIERRSQFFLDTLSECVDK